MAKFNFVKSEKIFFSSVLANVFEVFPVFPFCLCWFMRNVAGVGEHEKNPACMNEAQELYRSAEMPHKKKEATTSFAQH